MLVYSILNFQAGGPIFFVFLQGLVGIASLLMMLDTPDRFDILVVSIIGLGLIVWSLWLFEDLRTIFFVLGLAGIGLGYAFESGTCRRSLALTLGSILIAIFSYLEMNWIFFWLNFFFAIFAGRDLFSSICISQKKP